MEALDSIRLNFDPSQLVLMNICLAFIMFGIALDLKLQDFRLLVEKKKWVLVCLFSQLIALPLMTFAFIKVFNPINSVALGLVMVASCPGGNISNYFTHLAKGNSALSIALTSVVTTFSFVLTPLVFAGLIYGLALDSTDIYLDPWSVSKTVLLIILIPLVVGMVINYHFGEQLALLRTILKKLSLVIFLVFILFALKDNLHLIKNYLGQVFSIVVGHNALALLVGYSIGKLFFTRQDNIRTITIETGIQNSGLGLILIFNYFQDLGGMAMVAAFWGIWDMISGLLLSLYWSRKGSS